MYHNEQFSLPEERWAEISDFPSYSVSDRGRVKRLDSQRIVTPTRNTHGAAIVGLMRDNKQCKRSLAVLVADAFVPRPSQPAFNTPVHINGDRGDNVFTNLMWRPLWFAQKYIQQFKDDHTTYDGPIQDVETGQTYSNSWSAAIHNGLLDHQICEAMANNTYVFPTGQIFRTTV